MSTAAAKAADETGLYMERALELYRRMLLIRRFEDSVQSLFMRGDVPGTTHLYTGQEAVAVGVASMLEDDDRVAATYRGHGHALALGVDPQALMSEMLGRATGVCKGRAGSMNVIDLKHRLIGSFGIVGGSIAAATGAALALQRTGSGAVAVAYFGDGTVNGGYFHECLNFAKVLKLPVLYVCENNLYGEFTPWEAVTAGEIQARARTFGIEAQTLDGNDLWAVRAGAQQALEGIRGGGGPQFIEALTYRHVGHSRSDPGAYRKPGELDAWKQRDPLKLTRAGLRKRFRVATATIDQIDQNVEDQIQELIAGALAAPYPEPGPAREFKE